MKCTESRRLHGFGASHTVQSESAGRTGRSHASQASGIPAACTSSSQLTSLQTGHRQHTAIDDNTSQKMLLEYSTVFVDGVPGRAA
jgi:hypothetical protein